MISIFTTCPLNLISFIYLKSVNKLHNYKRLINQIWIIYILESPFHVPNLKKADGLINWTATYRHDSDIVTPYEKFVLYNENVKVTLSVLFFMNRINKLLNLNLFEHVNHMANGCVYCFLWYMFICNVQVTHQFKDYSLGKTKKVAWFVSNCGARNGRLSYARELARHIDVDIYGV